MSINQLRRNLITGNWAIIVMDQINLENLITPKSKTKSAVSNCQFCEGNEKMTPPEIMALRRDGFGINAGGWRVRVIPDKNPVLQIYGDLNNRAWGIYDVLDGIGAHEIVIETPHHDETLADLNEDRITEVFWTYKERILDLKQDTRFRYILVHKNMGEAVGPTADHSYSFVIGSPITPKRVKDELINSRDYFNYKERCIFCDIIHQELRDKERIVLEDGIFVGLTPFASSRPFEVWILPQKHETFFELNQNLRPLARMIKEILQRISKLLNNPNYIMAIHSGPNLQAGNRRGYWRTLERDYHWHIEITPQLRTYSSFEASSGFPINSVPPEKAAELLRDVK